MRQYRCHLSTRALGGTQRTQLACTCSSWALPSAKPMSIRRYVSTYMRLKIHASQHTCVSRYMRLNIHASPPSCMPIRRSLARVLASLVSLPPLSSSRSHSCRLVACHVRSHTHMHTRHTLDRERKHQEDARCCHKLLLISSASATILMSTSPRS
jgi:hypothetical protein